MKNLILIFVTVFAFANLNAQQLQTLEGTTWQDLIYSIWQFEFDGKMLKMYDKSNDFEYKADYYFYSQTQQGKIIEGDRITNFEIEIEGDFLKMTIKDFMPKKDLLLFSKNELEIKTTPAPNNPNELAGKIFMDNICAGVFFIYFFSNNYFIEEIDDGINGYAFSLYEGTYTYNSETKQGVITRYDGQNYGFKINSFTNEMEFEKFVDDWEMNNPLEGMPYAECGYVKFSSAQEEQEAINILLKAHNIEK